MEPLHELLNRLLAERKMRPVDLVRSLRGDPAVVTSWLDGTAVPPPPMLDRIAQSLHVDKQWLRYKSGIPQPASTQKAEGALRTDTRKSLATREGIPLPLLGRVWCNEGFWCEIHNERAVVVVEESRKITEEPTHYFLIESAGDRMEDYGIHDEDFLLCRFQDSAEPGDIVVALCIEDLITVKEFWRLPDQTPVLRGNHKRTWYEGEQLLEIQGKFLGKVKGRRIV